MVLYVMRQGVQTHGVTLLARVTLAAATLCRRRVNKEGIPLGRDIVKHARHVVATSVLSLSITNPPPWPARVTGFASRRGIVTTEPYY